MRDVAPAGISVTTNANAAKSAACSVLVTLCSPLSADVPYLKRRPCQRRAIELQSFSGAKVGVARSRFAGGGKNCPRVYLPLTIPEHLRSGEREKRDRGIKGMRIYGPNGTALATAAPAKRNAAGS